MGPTNRFRYCGDGISDGRADGRRTTGAARAWPILLPVDRVIRDPHPSTQPAAVGAGTKRFDNALLLLRKLRTTSRCCFQHTDREHLSAFGLEPFCAKKSFVIVPWPLWSNMRGKIGLIVNSSHFPMASFALANRYMHGDGAAATTKSVCRFEPKPKHARVATDTISGR